VCSRLSRGGKRSFSIYFRLGLQLAVTEKDIVPRSTLLFATTCYERGQEVGTNVGCRYIRDLAEVSGAGVQRGPLLNGLISQLLATKAGRGNTNVGENI
jgi:hypothetical protein